MTTHFVSQVCDSSAVRGADGERGEGERRAARACVKSLARPGKHPPSRKLSVPALSAFAAPAAALRPSSVPPRQEFAGALSSCGFGCLDSSPLSDRALERSYDRVQLLHAACCGGSLRQEVHPRGLRLTSGTWQCAPGWLRRCARSQRRVSGQFLCEVVLYIHFVCCRTYPVQYFGTRHVLCTRTHVQL